MSALLTGVLVAHERSGLGVKPANSGVALAVTWPYGFTGRMDDDGRLALIDAEDRVVAREGDLVRVGGGLPGEDQWLACGGLTAAGSPAVTEPTSTAVPAATPGSSDAALVAAARTYAAAAGFELGHGDPSVTEGARPDFDDVRLRLVEFPIESGIEDATLRIYLDEAGAVRVVSDGLAFIRPTGPDISADEILAAAARHFGLAGIDPASGTLRIVAGAPGQAWYVTLDRTIEGFPVANHPMWWGIAGDHAYVSLRTDGSLVELYAIRPEAAPLAPTLPTDVLADQLASVIGSSGSETDELEPSFTWVRATDPRTGAMAVDLTLGYCATETFDAGWNGYCVDAATGEKIVQAGGID